VGSVLRGSPGIYDVWEMKGGASVATIEVKAKVGDTVWFLKQCCQCAEYRVMKDVVSRAGEVATSTRGTVTVYSVLGWGEQRDEDVFVDKKLAQAECDFRNGRGK